MAINFSGISGLSGLFGDYATIKNGSYKKLLNAYYSKVEGSREATMEKFSQKVSKEDSKPTVKAEKEVLSSVKANADLVAFIEHEIELLENKNKSKSGEKKPTERQRENEQLKKLILEHIKPDTLYAGADFLREIPALKGESNQRVAALMKQLMENEGKVERVQDKNKVFWKLA